MNLEEEIICDFKVTEKRKRIWQCQLGATFKKFS